MKRIRNKIKKNHFYFLSLYNIKMSNLELGKNTSPIYSYQFLAMVTGTITSSSAGAGTLRNFYPGVSRILGVVRVTAGGTTGQPYVVSSVSSNAPVLTITSSSATDTSVYAVYYSNEVGSSQYLTVLPC